MTTVSTDQCNENRKSLKALLWRVAAGLSLLFLPTLGYSVGANNTAKETQSRLEAQEEWLQITLADIRITLADIRRTQTEILRNHAGGE